MTTTGIIVEYNPMHNGHLFHLEQTKKMTGCDSIVAVMSGNFVQRGEPAFVNKWARTKMALLGGVDLVLELPLLYSISSAEGFAFGAISTLDKLNVVDHVCFGSESGDIKMLAFIANILSQEPPSFKSFLQNELKSGISFPKARQNALTNYIITNNFANVNSNIAVDAVQSPNNILAIEYIKALIRLSSKINPMTINRIANHYNDASLTGNISSATSIRKNFFTEADLKDTIPAFTYEIINEEIKAGRGPLFLEHFSDMILYKLRNSEESYLRQILDMEIGLSHGMKRAAENSRSVSEMLDTLQNKRHPRTRLQRILLYCLLDITCNYKETIRKPAPYIRVLGFNKKGRAMLNKIKKQCNVPIISNPAANDIKDMHFDIAATDLYVLGYGNNSFKQARQDLKIPPVYLEK